MAAQEHAPVATAEMLPAIPPRVPLRGVRRTEILADGTWILRTLTWLMHLHASVYPFVGACVLEGGGGICHVRV